MVSAWTRCNQSLPASKISPHGPRRRRPRWFTTLTVETLGVHALSAVVTLVEVVIGARVVVYGIPHVHVPGVPVAELAVVPLGAIRSSVRTIIERPAHEVPRVCTLPLALG